MAKPKKSHKTLKKAAPRLGKKTKRDFELLGGSTVAVAAFLVISIFLGSSLDVVMIRSQQYAAVVATTLVDLANTDRTNNKLDGLTINPLLTQAAQMKANDMAAKSYFAHTSPEGIDPWYWFNQAGYKFSYAGENLAIDFSDSDAVNSAWMNSPTHRANLLDQHYTEIGIATAQGLYQGHVTTFVVEEFGKPTETAVATAPEPPQFATVPKNPTQPATATAIKPTAKVLGESTSPIPATSSSAAAAIDQTSETGPSISVTYASPVAHAVASPNTTLMYLYYVIAAIVLLLLVIATGFEIHVRHLKKAAGAGFLVALMTFLFFAGTKIVFTPPSVPQDASMAAAAIALQH